MSSSVRAVLRDHLVNRARPFIFDTGLNPAACAAALAALRVLQAEPTRPDAIHAATARLAAACGVPPAAGPVVSIPMPGPRETVQAADLCLAAAYASAASVHRRCPTASPASG